MGVRCRTNMCGGTKEDCIKKLKGANKPAAREICIEHDENFENISLKIGNGEDDYENLPYFINNNKDILERKEQTKMEDETVDTMRSVVKFVIMVAIVLGLALSITIFIFNHRISKLESQLEKYKTESSISDDEVDNSEESYRDEEDEG